MSGRATLATARFRLATAATRIRAPRTSPDRAGPVDVAAASGDGARAVIDLNQDRSRLKFHPPAGMKPERRRIHPIRAMTGRGCWVLIDTDRRQPVDSEGVSDE